MKILNELCEIWSVQDGRYLLLRRHCEKSEDQNDDGVPKLLPELYVICYQPPPCERPRKSEMTPDGVPEFTLSQGKNCPPRTSEPATGRLGRLVRDSGAVGRLRETNARRVLAGADVRRKSQRLRTTSSPREERRWTWAGALAGPISLDTAAWRARTSDVWRKTTVLTSSLGVRCWERGRKLQY